VGEKYVISYDLGTSGVKVALVDLTGKFLYDATENYSLITPQPGWAEQDPMEYWDSVCKATKRVLEKSGFDPADAQGLAIGTMWKGIIPVDAEGNVLHNSIIWMDNRAEDQAKRLNAHFGKELFCGADYWPKLMWFRENCPDLYDKAVTILETNSFLKWKATGVAMVDIANHFTRSFDTEVQEFYNEYLRFCDIDLDKFPPLAVATDFVGHISEEGAKAMGLVPGIPVYAGCSDISAIPIGCASTNIDAVHTYFGSSGWVGVSKKHVAGDVYVSPFDPERDIKIHGTQAVGLALNWAVEQLYHKEFEEMGGAVYDFINQDIADIPAGSNGLFVTPWVRGERPPCFSEAARGCFLNLNSTHDRRHMMRALMEGVCYTLKMVSQEYWNEIEEKPACINAVGGGACSDVWMQSLANILNIPVNVPRFPRHAGAVGVAYCALIGLGYCKDYDAISEQLVIERRFEPQPEMVKLYEEGFEIFKGLYGMLEPLFLRMNQ